MYSLWCFRLWVGQLSLTCPIANSSTVMRQELSTNAGFTRFKAVNNTLLTLHPRKHSFMCGHIFCPRRVLNGVLKKSEPRQEVTGTLVSCMYVWMTFVSEVWMYLDMLIFMDTFFIKLFCNSVIYTISLHIGNIFK